MFGVFIAGNLGGDVDIRTTKNNTRYCRLSIAVSLYNKEKEVIWVSAVSFEDGSSFFPSDKLIPYLKKGSSVIVTGDMKKPVVYNGKISLDISMKSIRLFGSVKKVDSSDSEENFEESDMKEFSDFINEKEK